MIEIDFMEMTGIETLGPFLFPLTTLTIGCLLPINNFSLNCTGSCFVFLEVPVACPMSFTFRKQTA